MTKEELQKEINALEARIKVIKDSPRTRESAMGGMILEGHLIREWEDKDEKLGKLKAELHRLTNTDDKEEVQLIYYGTNHVVETYIKNGILVKGGLLERHFKGRVATEHESYVINRHSRKCEGLVINNITIEKTQDEEPIQGIINIDCTIGNIEYKGETNFKSRVDRDTFFYFDLENNKIRRVIDQERGLSKKEKTLLKYTCARVYRDTFKPNTNINLVN